MKALFSKAKLGKLRNFLSLLLIMGCYVIYQRFLVVAYYDIGLFIVVTVVAVLYDKLIASKGFDAIVNNACICWTVVGLTLMLRSYYLPEKIYKVPLDGFSTFRVDHIYFYCCPIKPPYTAISSLNPAEIGMISSYFKFQAPH